MQFGRKSGKTRPESKTETQEAPDRTEALLSYLLGKGVSVKSLRRGWRDEEAQQGEIFFLVPSEPAAAHSGWFTWDELEGWAQGLGVIPKDDLLEEINGLTQFLEKSERLLKRASVEIKGRPIPAWVVPESKVPGVRILSKDQELLPDGVYSLPHLAVMLSLDVEETVETN